MNNNNIVDNVDAIENHFKQLCIFDDIFGVRVQPRPIIWSFKNFDVVLKPYRGYVTNGDSSSYYQGYGVVIEMFNGETTFPLKYYNTVQEFALRFGQDEISYLRRRTTNK